MIDQELDWIKFAASTWRLKVDGGHLYLYPDSNGNVMCFVPDVDLTRYQAHLRDAYNQGLKDGKEQTIQSLKESWTGSWREVDQETLDKIIQAKQS